MFIFIGSFSTNIAVFSLDEEHRTLSFLSQCDETGPSPSWLSLSRSGHHLLCTNETNNFEGAESGAVSIFSIERIGPELTLKFINRVSSCGAWPCHLTINEDDSVVYASNYFSGTLAVIPIAKVDSNLHLKPAIQTVSHKIGAPSGSEPHAHQSVLSTVSTLTVVDLGLDEVKQYSRDPSTGTLNIEPSSVNRISTVTKFGPRHIAIHPTCGLAFLLCELQNKLITLQFDHSSGVLKHFDDGSEVHTQSTLVDNNGVSFPNTSDMGASGILISSDGRFVYTSNRDIAAIDERRSSIVVFEITDSVKGNLKRIQTIYSGGRHPRHFAFVKTTNNGDLLLVTNKDSNNVVIFLVDPETGLIDEASAVVNTSPYIVEPSFVLCTN